MESYAKYFAPDPKNKTWVSSKYRAHVKSQPSIVSGKRDRNEPHHYRKNTGGGTSHKPSDVFCVPLTFDEHIPGVHAGKIKLDEQKVINWCFTSLSKYLKRDLKEFPRTREGLIELSNYLVEHNIK